MFVYIDCFCYLNVQIVSPISWAGLFESRITVCNSGITLTEKLFFFSYVKMFFTTYDLCTLRLFQLKTEGKTIFPDVLTECYKTEIKFLANPGLAED